MGSNGLLNILAILMIFTSGGCIGVLIWSYLFVKESTKEALLVRKILAYVGLALLLVGTSGALWYWWPVVYWDLPLLCFFAGFLFGGVLSVVSLYLQWFVGAVR